VVKDQRDNFIQGRPVASYFGLTLAVSWIGALAVAAPHVMRHEPLPKMTGILMFPAMLLGPSLVGIVMTRVTEGRSGLTHLFSRMFRGHLPLRWYAALLIPPVLVLTVLSCLTEFVSPNFTPNRFLMGAFFGIPAGLLEEIGWMGFAFPKMRSQSNALAPGILLGLFWSIWHLPAIDFLGTATPHGHYWFPFFLAFTLAMTAMRVLICWIYTNTNSVFMAQLMHMSSTGSLVIFSAPRVTATQEVLWYILYGISLWLGVAIIVRNYGKRLTRQIALGGK
jgi:membrane protease YdiL (CAAX protease family)